MSCNTCPQFYTLPNCLESLVVGTITSQLNVDFEIYLKNHTSGYLAVFEASTDGAGLLTITVPDSFVPTPKHDYELWVTEVGTETTSDRQRFVIDGTQYTCARFTFELIHAGANLASYASQTLTPIV